MQVLHEMMYSNCHY